MKICSVNNCERKALAKGFCNLHYQRFIRNIPMEGRKKLTLLERINSKIIKRENGCWEWTGAKSGGDGREQFKYGYIRINTESKRVHRVLYELMENVNLAGELLCHRCDNPLCVNPEHLFIGTQKDNVHDMIDKKRDYHPCGEDNHSKLKTEEILKIKQLFLSGMPYGKIGKIYNISEGHIGKIIREEKWKHLHSNEVKCRLKAGIKTKLIGDKNPQYDHTVYSFCHKKHGVMVCTKCELRKKYNIDHKSISLLCKGQRQTAKGWIVQKRPRCVTQG